MTAAEFHKTLIATISVAKRLDIESNDLTFPKLHVIVYIIIEEIVFTKRHSSDPYFEFRFNQIQSQYDRFCLALKHRGSTPEELLADINKKIVERV